MSANNDPVSEFLAREQSALADLGDEFGAPVSPQPPTNENGYSAGDDTGLTNGGSNYGSGTDLNNLNNFNGGASMPVLNGSTNGSLRDSPVLSNSNSRSQSRQPEEEPENIRKWRQQQMEMIAEKDKIEETKKEELRQQAKKELDQFYAQRKAQLEQRKKLNREREAALEEAVPPKDQDNAELLWERVARMIEAGPNVPAGKSTKTGQGSSTIGKDTSRMKQLIVSYARGEQNEKSPSPEVPKKELGNN